MNARDYYKLIGEETDLHYEKVQEVMQAMITVAISILKEGDEVRIPKVGKFYLKEIPEKEHVDRFALGRGENVVHSVPRHYMLKFEPFDSFHLEVNRDVT